MILDMKAAQEQLLLLFEQHLFILADPIPENEFPAIEGVYIEVKMDFSGDVNGSFIMLFPEDKSKEVMGNFLGLESDDPQLGQMSHFDAAAEIMNILGAHILSVWLQDKGSFNIGLPVTSIFTLKEKELFLKDKNITGMLIDDEPIYLKILFN
jgi:CheY-specific phosphatase CheX